MLPSDIKAILNPRFYLECEGDAKMEEITIINAIILLREQNDINKKASEGHAKKPLPTWVQICFGCQAEGVQKDNCGEECIYCRFESVDQFLEAKEVFDVSALQQWLSNPASRYEVTESVVRNARNFKEALLDIKNDRLAAGQAAAAAQQASLEPVMQMQESIQIPNAQRGGQAAAAQQTSLEPVMQMQERIEIPNAQRGGQAAAAQQASLEPVMQMQERIENPNAQRGGQATAAQQASLESVMQMQERIEIPNAQRGGQAAAAQQASLEPVIQMQERIEIPNAQRGGQAAAAQQASLEPVMQMQERIEIPNAQRGPMEDRLGFAIPRRNELVLNFVVPRRVRTPRVEIRQDLLNFVVPRRARTPRE